MSRMAFKIAFMEIDDLQVEVTDQQQMMVLYMWFRPDDLDDPTLSCQPPSGPWLLFSIPQIGTGLETNYSYVTNQRFGYSYYWFWSHDV